MGTWFAGRLCVEPCRLLGAVGLRPQQGLAVDAQVQVPVGGPVKGELVSDTWRALVIVVDLTDVALFVVVELVL